jgi:hypothetical protein
MTARRPELTQASDIKRQILSTLMSAFPSCGATRRFGVRSKSGQCASRNASARSRSGEPSQPLSAGSPTQAGS